MFRDLRPAHVEAFRLLLEWIIADRLSCFLKDMTMGPSAPYAWFSVMGFLFVMLSSGLFLQIRQVLSHNGF